MGLTSLVNIFAAAAEKLSIENKELEALKTQLQIFCREACQEVLRAPGEKMSLPKKIYDDFSRSELLAFGGLKELFESSFQPETTVISIGRAVSTGNGKSSCCVM